MTTDNSSTPDAPSKPWYQSKAILGQIATGIISLLAIYKVDLTGIDINQTVMAIGALIATGVAIYGRVTAKHQITARPVKTSTSLLVVFLIPFLLIGCASTSPSVDPTPTPTTVNVAPADNAKFVTAIKAAVVVEKAGFSLAYAILKGDEKTNFPKYVSGSGYLLASFENGTVPTDDQVKNGLSPYFPTSSASYAPIVQAITTATSTIKSFIDLYIPSSYTNVADYINYALDKLAQGAYAWADPYLTTTSS